MAGPTTVLGKAKARANLIPGGPASNRARATANLSPGRTIHGGWKFLRTGVLPAPWGPGTQDEIDQLRDWLVSKVGGEAAPVSALLRIRRVCDSYGFTECVRHWLSNKPGHVQQLAESWETRPGKGVVSIRHGASAASSVEIDADDPDVGYFLARVDGHLPSGLTLPKAARPARGLSLHWIDGALDHQDAFAFTLKITSVDRAGNLGEPIEILIEDDGIR